MKNPLKAIAQSFINEEQLIDEDVLGRAIGRSVVDALAEKLGDGGELVIINVTTIRKRDRK